MGCTGWFYNDLRKHFFRTVPYDGIDIKYLKQLCKGGADKVETTCAYVESVRARQKYCGMDIANSSW